MLLNGELGNVPGRLRWFQRRRPVGHGGECVGVDGGLLGGRLQPPREVRRSLERRGGVSPSIAWARAAGPAPSIRSTATVFACRGRLISSAPDGPAVESIYRFVLWLVPTVEKFPRHQKFLLGDRLQATVDPAPRTKGKSKQWTRPPGQ